MNKAQMLTVFVEWLNWSYHDHLISTKYILCDLFSVLWLYLKNNIHCLQKTPILNFLDINLDFSYLLVCTIRSYDSPHGVMTSADNYLIMFTH